MSDASDSRPTTPLPDTGDEEFDRDRPLSEERDGFPAADNDNVSNNDDDSDLSEVDEAEFEKI